MGNDTKKPRTSGSKRAWGLETIEGCVRERVKAIIEQVLEAELLAVLGAAPSARVGDHRRGYRNGTRVRTLTTSVGTTPVAVPRARLFAGAAAAEWHPQTLRRYERRTPRVDEAILGAYLAGANTRRLRSALGPLLDPAPLSKDVVSRLVGRLQGDFDTWRERDLRAEAIRYLVLDGWYPKVRIGKQRVRVPVLVTLGVRASGERIVLDLRLVGDESHAAWQDAVAQLVRRGLGRPGLAIIDGNAGLLRALEEQWPGLAIQRCTAHKLRNVQGKAPRKLQEEVTEDFRRMIYVESAAAAERARELFLKKWRLKCPAVAASVEEAGDQLWTFLRFPPTQWKALRTTNALERINEEFRRRTKTQASLPSQDAVLLLLFGLLRAGHIRLRRIDGWEAMWAAAAGERAA
jgi:transposase-like protein